MYGMAPGICSLKITIHRTHFPFICLQEYAPSNPIQINPPIFSFHKVIFGYFPVRHKGKAESIHDSRSPWLHEIRRQRRMSISQRMKKSYIRMKAAVYDCTVKIIHKDDIPETKKGIEIIPGRTLRTLFKPEFFRKDLPYCLKIDSCHHPFISHDFFDGMSHMQLIC